MIPDRHTVLWVASKAGKKMDSFEQDPYRRWHLRWALSTGSKSSDNRACKEGIIHIMRCENCGEDKDVSEVPVLRKVRILG